jgi:hypothetical protein
MALFSLPSPPGTESTIPHRPRRPPRWGDDRFHQHRLEI